MNYNFIYEGNNPKEFLEDIEMIERDYNGRCLDVTDFTSTLSIQINFLGINFGHKKLVRFKTNKPVIKKCRRCEYPIKKSHLLPTGGLLKCRSCHEIYYEKDWTFKGGKYKHIQISR